MLPLTVLCLTLFLVVSGSPVPEESLPIPSLRATSDIDTDKPDALPVPKKPNGEDEAAEDEIRSLAAVLREFIQKRRGNHRYDNVSDDRQDVLERRGSRRGSSAPFSYGVNMDLLGASHPAGKLRPGQASFGDSCNKVTSVPSALRSKVNMWPEGIPTFYSKYTEAYDIPIVGSSKVTDEGLMRACYVVRYLFASRYDARNAYYKLYGRVALIADSEQQTDLYEYKTWDSSYWDSRARGLGPTIGIPMTSVGDDNQRCAKGDRYWDQDILVHELSHGLHLLSAAYTVEGFARDVGETYRDVSSKGKWKGLYAGRNPNEYFATGAQFYHEATSGFSLDAPSGSGKTKVNNRASLKNYDSDLTRLLEQVYSCAASSNNFIERCQYKASDSGQSVKSLCTSGPQGTSRCQVSSSDRETCGPSGVSSGDCAKIGCCWASNKCFYPTQDCRDKTVYCPDWAMNGECHRNPGYMYLNCPFSCGRCEKVKTLSANTLENMCQDKNGNCDSWAKSGECKNNPGYMKSNCPLGCGTCSAKDPFP